MKNLYVADYVVIESQRVPGEEIAGEYYEDGMFITYDLSLYDEEKEGYDYMILPL